MEQQARNNAESIEQYKQQLVELGRRSGPAEETADRRAAVAKGETTTWQIPAGASRAAASKGESDAAWQLTKQAAEVTTAGVREDTHALILKAVETAMPQLVNQVVQQAVPQILSHTTQTIEQTVHNTLATANANIAATRPAMGARPVGQLEAAAEKAEPWIHKVEPYARVAGEAGLAAAGIAAAAEGVKVGVKAIEAHEQKKKQEQAAAAAKRQQAAAQQLVRQQAATQSVSEKSVYTIPAAPVLQTVQPQPFVTTNAAQSVPIMTLPAPVPMFITPTPRDVPALSAENIQPVIEDFSAEYAAPAYPSDYTLDSEVCDCELPSPYVASDYVLYDVPPATGTEPPPEPEYPSCPICPECPACPTYPVRPTTPNGPSQGNACCRRPANRCTQRQSCCAKNTAATAYAEGSLPPFAAEDGSATVPLGAAAESYLPTVAYSGTEYAAPAGSAETAAYGMNDPSLSGEGYAELYAPSYASLDAFLAANPARGTLTVRALAADGHTPAAGVTVQVYRHIGGVNYIFSHVRTDAQGMIRGLSLPAPQKVLSYEPGRNDPPYAVYDLLVQEKGQTERAFHNITIFADTESLQVVKLPRKQNLTVTDEGRYTR
ncbi:MAG: hypothetical protein LBJ11_07450 [Oscillospiraceae bacterium]|nr:hypothetical protein [Oscillospiraceae bacterium]